MFQIGDKVVYPMHGAGVIEAIEEREVLGKNHQYYILKLPIGDLNVMIPLDNAENIGIRAIITPKEAKSVLKHFKDAPILAQDNWNKRYRENMLKIRSGNIEEVATVVKNLMVRDRVKGLSTGERKMMTTAKQILMSELLLVENTTEEALENTLSQVIEECIAERKVNAKAL